MKIAVEKYDYKLNRDQETLANEIHDESIIIDFLFQGPLSPNDIDDDISAKLYEETKIYDNRPLKRIFKSKELLEEMAIKGELDVFKDLWYASGVTVGNRQLQMDSLENAAISMGTTIRQFDNFDWLNKVLSADDIINAKNNNQKAGLISCQKSLGFGKNLDLLDAFYDMGLRMIQLTYNNHNFVGAGCTERNDAGVSNFGVKFIKRMNELGIIVDTGHCGKKTTLDACEISDAPVVCSHTAVKKLVKHNRNKTDEEFTAIAKTGGVIGLVCVPNFLNADMNLADMDDFLDHIDYLVNLVGADHVGIGTDWPMSIPKWAQIMIKERLAPLVGFKKEDSLPSLETVNGFSSYSQFINITRGLVSRGYKRADIEKIIGGNFLRVIKEVIG